MKRTLRVLHCIWTLGRGGAERQLSYLASECARSGVEVHVAFAFGGQYEEDLRRSSIGLHHLKPSGKKDPRVIYRLNHLMRSLRPDVVQTWLTQMDLIAGATALMRGIPWLMSERSVSEAYPRILLNRLRETLGRKADRVVANSEDGVRYWKRFRASGNLFIPNALPLDRIDSVQPQGLPNAPDAPILFVGRLGPEKNPGALISALALPEMAGFSALYCGEGMLREALEKQASDLNIRGRVHFADDVDDVWPVMKAASALVAPSLFEGSPNAVLEAAACGVPLVVSDIAAHRQILREESAVFVDPRSPQSLADGIREAIGPAAASRTRAAREDVQALDVQSMALRYDQVYRQLFSGER